LIPSSLSFTTKFEPIKPLQPVTMIMGWVVCLRFDMLAYTDAETDLHSYLLFSSPIIFC